MSYDKETNKKYLKDRYKKQRDMFFAYLGGEKCVKCGATENIEIDHINPEEKSFNLGKLWPIKKLPEVFAELDKCQPLCNSCHLSKTIEWSSGKEKGFSHGSYYGWAKKKCECESCF